MSRKKKKVKEKVERIDGLSSTDLALIHKAVRRVWSWSHPRRLVVKRATGKDGFPRCEQCKKKVPKITVDHIDPVGEVGGRDYIKRMWCSSKRLQALCTECHNQKTKDERAMNAGW